MSAKKKQEFETWYATQLQEELNFKLKEGLIAYCKSDVEPKQIQYVPLRNNYIDEIETQMSESENNNLAQFTDGAFILTLHFRRVR